MAMERRDVFGLSAIFRFSMFNPSWFPFGPASPGGDQVSGSATACGLNIATR